MYDSWVSRFYFKRTIMKITFFSNYLNHHQLPFSLEMSRLTDNNFYFASQKAISEKRIALGYKNISNDYSFVVKTYENETEMKRAYELASDSDLVIFGGNSKLDKFVIKRIREGKQTFEYSERLNKRKPSRLLRIKKYLNMFYTRIIYKNKPLYLLCSGSYVANDFKEFNMYQNKTYKWGYFPECKEYDVDELMNCKNSKTINILWAGRLIDWKHPETIIELARRLKENRMSFDIIVIGQGDMRDEIYKIVEKEDLFDCIHLLGSMSPDKVRTYMEKTNIFIFTSDFVEGWGAVLNEAMNSGCACIASHAIGSVGFLIKDKSNGLIYENQNIDDLYEKTLMLINDREYCKKLGINAYKTIANTWNAKVAAERFLVLAKALEEGKDTPFIDGPCSKAIPIKQKDMYNYLVNND